MDLSLDFPVIPCLVLVSLDPSARPHFQAVLTDASSLFFWLMLFRPASDSSPREGHTALISLSVLDCTAANFGIAAVLDANVAGFHHLEVQTMPVLREDDETGSQNHILVTWTANQEGELNTGGKCELTGLGSSLVSPIARARAKGDRPGVHQVSLGLSNSLGKVTK